MIIKTAEFEISNSDWRKCPATSLPEYAFIGRSNVGKSSLINATPGKTLLINHFKVNDSWYIVDLPGYGYARRGKEEREKLQHIIQGYILGREQMTCLFVLVDSRHEPQKIDLDFITWLGENGVPFALVFTKMDKMGRVAGVDKVEAYKRELLKSWEELPPVFMTSSEDKRGREEMLDYIQTINRSI